MTESEYHKNIKRILYQKLKEWFGASIPEYYDEAHELDVYAVTTDGLSIYVEVIFDPSRGHFRDDLLIIQRSNADLIFTIVNPEILKNPDSARASIIREKILHKNFRIPESNKLLFTLSDTGKQLWNTKEQKTSCM